MEIKHQFIYNTVRENR
jgi:hypothetical protein